MSDGYGNARVHRYTPDGGFIESWGKSGTFPGHFNIVHNISIDGDGWVYVADRDNRRIQVFDTSGEYQAQWVNLSRAACVYADSRGRPHASLRGRVLRRADLKTPTAWTWGRE